MNETRSRVVVVVATLGLGLALMSRARLNIWIFTGILAVLVLVGAAWAAPECFRSWFRIRLASVFWGVVTGLVFVGITHVGAEMAVGFDERISPMIRDLYAAVNFPPGPRAAFPVVLLVATMEEVVWRGLVIEMLKEKRALVVLVVSVILYAIPQIASLSLPLLGAAIFCGALWGALRLWRGDLVAPLVNHLVWNAGVFVLAPLRV